MARNWVHTVHKDDQWVVEVEGQGVRSTHRTKEDAVAAGRHLAIQLQTEHVIHNLDGSISERNSYGRDKFPPAG